MQTTIQYGSGNEYIISTSDTRIRARNTLSSNITLNLSEDSTNIHTRIRMSLHEAEVMAHTLLVAVAEYKRDKANES